MNISYYVLGRLVVLDSKNHLCSRYSLHISHYYAQYVLCVRIRDNIEHNSSSMDKTLGVSWHCSLYWWLMLWIYHTVNHLRCFLSTIHPPSHLVIWSFSYSVTRSLLLSSCHPVIWSFDHSVIWSFGHLVTWSLSHSVTWSLGHSVTPVILSSSFSTLSLTN